jgi:MFS family permease
MSSVKQQERASWALLALLVMAIGICFIDRGNLSVALSSIRQEFQLSESNLGVLAAAFFVSYTLMQLVVGKLLEWLDVAWFYAGAFFVWSIASIFTSLAHSLTLSGITLSGFAVLLVLRLVSGCGESVSYPASALLLTKYFPEGLRGTANSLIDAGSKIGPALGIMVGTSLVVHTGWRTMFLALGSLSMLWLLPWIMVTWKLDTKRPDKKQWSPSYLEIARQPSFWGASMGHVGGNYMWSLVVSWFPYYFEKHCHFSMSQLVLINSIPFWALAVSSVASGLGADVLIRRGLRAVRVRQATVCIGCIGCALFLVPAALVTNSRLDMLLIVGASLSLGLFSSNNWALAQSLSGQHAAAKWTSLQNLFANAAAAAAAWLTGVTLGMTHSFTLAFSIAAALLLMGTCFYWFAIDASGPVAWKHQKQDARLASGQNSCAAEV